MAPQTPLPRPESEVRKIREQYGLSQDKFASLMGISVATLRNWEQGRRNPEGPSRVLLRVAALHPEAILDTTRRQRINKTSTSKRSTGLKFASSSKKALA